MHFKLHIRRILAIAFVVGLLVALGVPAAWADLYTCVPVWGKYGQMSSLYGSFVDFGDVNGDGYADLSVSARLYDYPSSCSTCDYGAVYVYHGSASGYGSSEDWMGWPGAGVGQAGLNYGSVVDFGDLNGDGYDDLAVGAPGTRNPPDMRWGGRIYVYHGSPGGLSASPNWTAELGDYDLSRGGKSLAFGDFDGDGYADLAVGAIWYENGQADEGAVFVWHGSPSGLGANGTPGNADWFAESNQNNAHLGTYLAAGDVDADGYDELAASAPGYDFYGTDDGRVFLWHGSASGLGANGTPANADWAAGDDSAGASAFGGANAITFGDFNGDSFDDIAIGSYTLDRVYVWLGSGASLGGNGTPGNADQTLNETQSGTRYGYALQAGDTNADGYADLAIGAPYYDDAGYADRGRIWMRHGAASGLGAHVEGFSYSTWSGAHFGMTVALGDANNDGYLDVAGGKPDDMPAGVGTGGALVTYYDDQAPTNPTITETNGVPDDTWQDTVNDPNFSWSGATDNVGIQRYRYYWGSNPDGALSSTTALEGYDPPALNTDRDRIYYLKVQTEDVACILCEDGPITYTFKYDGPPVNPVEAWETHGLAPQVWRNYRTPAYAWDAAQDTYPGVEGYYVYFGASVTGTSTITTASEAYTPPALPLDTWGIYYLRLGAYDGNGHQSSWSTMDHPWTGTTLVYKYDGVNPSTPAGVRETNGLPDDTWQNYQSTYDFAWDPSSDEGSGMQDYGLIWSGSSWWPAAWTSSATHSFSVSESGTYEFSVFARDVAFNWSDVSEIFTVRYDIDDPSHPTVITETHEVQDGVSQEAVSDPNFVWSGAADAHSGVDDYHVYFGPSITGTSTITTSSPAYDPPALTGPGTYYLRLQTKDVAGNLSAWQTAFTFILDSTDHDGDGVLSIYEDLDGDGNRDNDDSDGDGVADYLDDDDDGDGVLTTDEEADPDGDGNPSDAVDSDGDSVPNYLDADDDGDGVPTVGEDPNGSSDPTDDDTDGDGIPDYLDEDDDGDGIPTTDEDTNGNGDPTDDDSDGDGIPDYLDGDDDGDGIPTADEDTNGNGDPTDDDSDGDGIPDYLDGDDDGDGIPTAGEDPNGNGDPTDDDSDGDGIPDYLDGDDDGDGIPTADEDPNGNGDPTDDDSDGDGIPDYLDTDSDGDGIPDSVEGSGDADGDGIPNYLDTDSDGDGMSDGWEHDNGLDPYTDDASADADGDGLTNFEEYQLGTDPQDVDTDGDSVHDGYEADNPIVAPDTDHDGLIDALDPDDDGDSVWTIYEYPDANGDGDPADAVDTDGDGTPDYLDENDDDDIRLTQDEEADPNGDGDPSDAVDTDGDGIPDYLDGDDGFVFTDADGDSIPDAVEGTSDPDGDGVPNYLDDDSDGDSILDRDEAGDGDPTTMPVDTDGDGIRDYLDLESDGDDISDSDEAGDAYPATPPVDTDGDGRPDFQDLDSDGDGMPDAWETANGLDPLVDDAAGDPDGDGLTNLEEYQNGTDPQDADTDGDLMPDGWEVANGLDPLADDAGADPDGDGLSNLEEYRLQTDPQNADSDGDGIDDGAEVGNPVVPRDTDGDGLLDALDLDSDDDGIPDAVEWDEDQNSSTSDDLCINLTEDQDVDGIPGCQDNDADGDGVPNYRDTDSDGDGNLDGDEGTGDADGDGISDYLDPAIPDGPGTIYLPLILK